MCAAAGIEIEHVNKSHIRKEERVARVLRARGHAPGLVHVISAMEGCPSYKPWHDKASGKTFLRPALGKCLHYYFYFIDEQFGLCYLRVADVGQAQALAERFNPDELHRRLDRYASWLCPVLDVFGQTYHWRSGRPSTRPT